MLPTKSCRAVSIATPMAFKKPNASVFPWLLIEMPFNPISIAPLYKRGSMLFLIFRNDGKANKKPNFEKNTAGRGVL